MSGGLFLRAGESRRIGFPSGQAMGPAPTILQKKNKKMILFAGQPGSHQEHGKSFFFLRTKQAEAIATTIRALPARPAFRITTP
jgi:hypothetical protein